MDTKINDFATKLMSNAISSLKEAKTKKAESAFYSLLDHAINNSTSKGKADDFQSVASNAGKENETNVRKDALDDNVQNMQSVRAERSEQPIQNAPVEEGAMKKTGMEKAEEIVKNICAELDITEEELFAQFDQLLSAIAALMMEKFNITEQDLNNVLQDMGLSLTDLFNQSDLMQVSVMLAGAEDISAVLTDENLYQQIQDLSKEMVDLRETFAPEQELDVQQLKELEESIETIAAGTETVVSIENEDFSIRQESVRQTDLVETTAIEEPVLEIVTDKANSQGAADRKSDNQEQPMTGHEGFQQFVGKVAEYADQTINVGNEFAQQADMESIIRQVTDYVKMQVHAETTSLEMQLHPESYGKLNLQVSVRDGVVTAKMAVENEMVRSALEAQVVQLREDMNERGLRVDAVEVTIASHEFERNLEEGQGNQESAQEDTSQTHRQINLQESGMSLDELAAMSEAEALTRKIMLENGNSIDFSA